MEHHEVTGDANVTPEAKPSFKHISQLQRWAHLMVLAAALLVPKFAHAQTQTKETILEQSATLETAYGFNIHFPDDPKLEPILKANTYYGEQLSDLDQFSTALGKLEKQLKKYQGYIDFPHFDIYFVRNLFYDDLKRAAGFSTKKTIVFDTYYLDTAVDHELFHGLDENDGMAADNESWAQAHPEGMKVYTNPYGAHALATELEPNKHIPHFARKYGKDGGPDEDQATIADTLLENEEIIPWIVEKIMNGDEIIQNKVTRETGCEFSKTLGIFTRLLTEEEYSQKFNTKGYEYYPKWSRDAHGKVRMDVEFWNKRIEQGIPTKKAADSKDPLREP